MSSLVLIKWLLAGVGCLREFRPYYSNFASLAYGNYRYIPHLCEKSILRKKFGTSIYKELSSLVLPWNVIMSQNLIIQFLLYISQEVTYGGLKTNQENFKLLALKVVTASKYHDSGLTRKHSVLWKTGH